jgi:hypothetical protein
MVKNLFKDKKGFSLSGYVEVALMTTLFMLLFIGLIAEFNVKIGKTYDGTFGLSSSLASTQSDLEGYQATLEKSVKEGQSSSTGLGISLSTTWGIISSGATIMWNFLTGGFIETIGGMLRLPTAVSQILRVLFVLSIGFIILKLVLRIKP